METRVKEEREKISCQKNEILLHFTTRPTQHLQQNHKWQGVMEQEYFSLLVT